MGFSIGLFIMRLIPAILRCLLSLFFALLVLFSLNIASFFGFLKAKSKIGFFFTVLLKNSTLKPVEKFFGFIFKKSLIEHFPFLKSRPFLLDKISGFGGGLTMKVALSYPVILLHLRSPHAMITISEWVF